MQQYKEQIAKAIEASLGSYLAPVMAQKCAAELAPQLATAALVAVSDSVLGAVSEAFTHLRAQSTVGDDDDMEESGSSGGSGPKFDLKKRIFGSLRRKILNEATPLDESLMAEHPDLVEAARSKAEASAALIRERRLAKETSGGGSAAAGPVSGSAVAPEVVTPDIGVLTPAQKEALLG